VDDLRWGIISTGRIARVFADHLTSSATGRLMAVASRDRARADAFGAPHAHANYGDLLADDEVDAVYIATPHPMHAMWAVRAAEAGKHVLCEKPLAMNIAEAEAAIEAARRHNVFLMEAFMYRCHPQTAALVDILRSGKIGDVRVIEAVHSFAGPEDPTSRLLAKNLGGGGILDVGCYCTSLARLVAQAALGVDVVEPVEVSGMAKLSPSGVDEYATGLLRLPGDILATISCGIRLAREDGIRVFGTRGQLTVPQPAWIHPLRGPGTSQIILTPSSGEPEVIEVEATQGVFAREADHVATHVGDRQAPELTWAETLANMRTLDRWREAVGYGRPA
jgi:predicted dehydrogenase